MKLTLIAILFVSANSFAKATHNVNHTAPTVAVRASEIDDMDKLFMDDRCSKMKVEANDKKREISVLENKISGRCLLPGARGPAASTKSPQCESVGRTVSLFKRQLEQLKSSIQTQCRS